MKKDIKMINSVKVYIWYVNMGKINIYINKLYSNKRRIER
jgi:hypothetical protein